MINDDKMTNRILIVDDAPSILRLMEDILKEEYIIKTALCGENAIDILQTYKPDIVLLDVTMPGIDGYEVCRRIKSDNSFGFIKVIMVSSGTNVKERLKGYEAGADDYISKPFNEEELLAKVRVFMRLKCVEDQLKSLNDRLNEQVRIRTEQLIDAERMAAVGRYSAGIVHNLNNPLQVIMGNAEVLAIKNPDNRNVLGLRKAAAHMKKIISSILSAGYREHKEEYVDIDLNAVINDQVELFKANMFFKHKIQTTLNLATLPLYCGIYHHFSQIISNLIRNAADAMYFHEPRCMVISTSVGDNAVIIRISDTGQGIPKENMRKIFDPFFTTKPLTATDDRPTGTGLGLASCREMIESYGGEITVESEVDKGTSVTVKLPIKPPSIPPNVG